MSRWAYLWYVWEGGHLTTLEGFLCLRVFFRGREKGGLTTGIVIILLVLPKLFRFYAFSPKAVFLVTKRFGFRKKLPSLLFIFIFF